MNYIVFDLEFNQPFSKEQLVLDPFPLCFEIVQIGAVKMDEKCRIQETIDIMVKPCFYKHIGNAARNRIGIYGKHFQQIMTFSEAYEKFLEFCGKEYCLFSWGANDINILNKNVLIHGLQPNYGVMCFDVQKLFIEHFEEGKSQIGLQDAIKKMHLERYTAHNAFNDAYSTAEILSKLMITPKKTHTINKIIECDDVLYIDEECFSKSDAIKRAKESKIICSCGAQANMGHMIWLGKSKVIASSQCVCGKEYFIVVKTLKSKSGDQINLQCYKWIMSEELKTFYLKHKKIDDAIMEYAEKHNQKNKKIEGTEW